MVWGCGLLGLGWLEGRGKSERVDVIPSLNFRFVGVVRGDIPSYRFGFSVVSMIGLTAGESASGGENVLDSFTPHAPRRGESLVLVDM